jgi:hypothetical protein
MKIINNDSLDFEFLNNPFQHVIIDNFIKEDFLHDILKDMENLTIDKSYYYGHPEIEKNKYAFKKDFGDTLQKLFEELNSDEFITFLEKKSGIENIVKNNLDLNGAGVHKVLNNGFLCMHTDFEAYNDFEFGLLDRRINLLLYMNPDWKEEYHGELCLYDKIQHKITKKVLPILNRCVIFFTPDNIHGHPTPLNIPENICRQSITTYYYTHNKTGKNLNGANIKQVMWHSNIKET